MKQIAVNGGRTEIEIPADATQPCGLCDADMVPIEGTLHVDEGDGSASVGLHCPNEHQAGHDWVLSDREYEAEFGHPF